jgi:hypothetical protein
MSGRACALRRRLEDAVAPVGVPPRPPVGAREDEVAAAGPAEPQRFMAVSRTRSNGSARDR